MKKLAKTLILALLFVPMFFACTSLTGDLEELNTSTPDLVTQESGGGEDDGEDFPKGGQ